MDYPRKKNGNKKWNLVYIIKITKRSLKVQIFVDTKFCKTRVDRGI